MKNILITGGAGFIGSHVVRHFVAKYPGYNIVNLDKLTYAGSLEGLADLEGKKNYTFVQGDICDRALVARLFATHDIDGVIHLAAESHVDRSIGAPAIFAQTNVLGTLTLLEAARASWCGAGDDWGGRRFYQISTDEVYGALGSTGLFTEESRYDPHSPYSASKAAADHFVRAWHNTYGMPTLISNCTNNYGPGQFPEKLIPLMIGNIIAGRPLPVYGDGTNVRDWIWVGDHVEAIDAVFHRGTAGETYLAGGGNEVRNIDLVRALVRLVDEALGRPDGASDHLITFVTDRAGHDFRYAADISKISRELGWRPQVDFNEGLRRTVEWYVGKS
ncbi:MAG: dTDP-glucose 4,6-dehydratase [Alistipes sp.]|jgi:dTDP-glucose 4,6-dehydratase|nr:dTDP-glucose 4,6-dehydratase [Alistipes sp.]